MIVVCHHLVIVVYGKWTVRYQDTYFWCIGDDFWDSYGADGIVVDVCTEWDGECDSYGCSYILGMQH